MPTERTSSTERLDRVTPIVLGTAPLAHNCPTAKAGHE
jgi:hypothetical protein